MENPTLLKYGRILVVEDDPDIRETFEIILSNEGYSVLTASNGKEAIELLRKNSNVGLIFLDMQMPIMNGQRFLEVRQKSNLAIQTPVVVLTANQTAPQLGLYPEEHKIVRWVKKPIDLDELFLILKLHCKTFELYPAVEYLKIFSKICTPLR